MLRYWVNLGEWDYDLVTTLGEAPSIDFITPKDSDIQFIYNWVNQEMKSLANTATPGLLGDSWVFRTDSINEAKEIHWKATRIVALAFPGQEEMNMEMSIFRQTECSECGCLGLFSDDSCIRCGSQVLWEEYTEDEGAMIFDGNEPKVRCTQRNQDGNQCANQIRTNQIACNRHRQTVSLGMADGPNLVVNSE